MINLTIDDTLSLPQLKEVRFMASNYAEAQCEVTGNSTSITVESNWSWDRDSIKELIQFLKTVRKLLPREDE